MIDASNYNITVRKGWFDGELCFEACVAELPDVAEYADSFEEAYALAIDTLEVTAEIFANQAMPKAWMFLMAFCSALIWMRCLTAV